MTAALERVFKMLPAVAPFLRALVVHTSFCDSCRLSLAASFLSGDVDHLLTMEATSHNRTTAAAQLASGLAQWAGGEPHADLSIALSAELYSAMGLTSDEAEARAYLFLWALEATLLSPAAFPLKNVTRGLSSPAKSHLLAFVNLSFVRVLALGAPLQARQLLDSVSTRQFSGTLALRMTWLKARALHSLGEPARAGRALRDVFHGFIEIGEIEAAALALFDCAALAPEADLSTLASTFAQHFSQHPLAHALQPLASLDVDAVRPKLPSSFYRILSAPPLGFEGRP